MIDNSKWIDSPEHKRVLAEFFQDSPIQVSSDVEGMKVFDNVLFLGMRAGPWRCLTNLIHEMSHLVEIDDARVLKHGWGFTTPQIYMPGRHSYMASAPVSIQPIRREVRVIALQWQIQNELGIHVNKRETLSALKFMPDWCNVPSGLPGGYFDLPWEEQAKITVHTNEFRFAYLQAYMDECMSGKYNLSFFHTEWKRKNELLRSHRA